jgi:hypothetical protein
MSQRKPCTYPGCLNSAAGPYCSTHYRQKQQTGAMRPIDSHMPRPTTCGVEGCDKPRKGAQRLCSMHAARRDRHGDVNAVHVPVARERFVASHGYVVVRDAAHPLADRRGNVYEHRKVLFESIGPGVHSCAWCRKPIAWQAGSGVARLEVDHFNADRLDNHPANLLPSCHQCNAMRVDPYEEYRDGRSRRRVA